MSLSSLKAPAHRLAAILAAVVVLWITEAIPLPLTALIGAAACVVLQVAPAKEVFLPFADPLIFLFTFFFCGGVRFFVRAVRDRSPRGFHLARDAHHCPHGRPTSLLFSRHELDKQFRRT